MNEKIEDDERTSRYNIIITHIRGIMTEIVCPTPIYSGRIHKQKNNDLNELSINACEYFLYIVKVNIFREDVHTNVCIAETFSALVLQVLFQFNRLKIYVEYNLCTYTQGMIQKACCIYIIIFISRE